MDLVEDSHNLIFLALLANEELVLFIRVADLHNSLKGSHLLNGRDLSALVRLRLREKAGEETGFVTSAGASEDVELVEGFVTHPLVKVLQLVCKVASVMLNLVSVSLVEAYWNEERRWRLVHFPVNLQPFIVSAFRQNVEEVSL